MTTLNSQKGDTIMRVTKTIKEYINEKVNDAYSAKLEAMRQSRAEYDRQCDECYADLQALRSKWEQEACQLCAKYGFLPDTDWKDRPYSLVEVRQNYGHNARQAINVQEAALRQEINRETQNIIIELELGGDRAKLDAMLTALVEKIK